MDTDRVRPPGVPGGRVDDEPALILVESLIHQLLAKGVLEHIEAVDVVGLALETQIAFCAERDESPDINAAVAALSRIKATLVVDGNAMQRRNPSPAPEA